MVSPDQIQRKKKQLAFYDSVLEIKKKYRLSLFQKLGNQTREFSCHDESLVAC